MNTNFLKDSKTMNTIKNLLSAHGSTAAMIGGFGFFGLAICAAFKASEEIVKAREKFNLEKEKIASEDLEMPVETEKMREAKTTRNISYVLAYKWVILFGTAGFGLMTLTKIMDGHAIATWAGIAATQKDKIEKLGENAKKIIGEEKFKEIQDKTAEDSFLQNFMSNGEPFALELDGKDLEVFMEPETEMIFLGNKADLTIALNNAKEECARNHSLQASKLYSDKLAIDLSSSQKGKDLGYLYWGPKNEFDWKFGECKRRGCTWQTVEWVRQPTSGKAAGVPGFGK